jgi:outer membrane protein TolC
LAGYWEYRTYQARRLPSLTLDLTPARYYRTITSRYDSEQNIDVYLPQQSYQANGSLSVYQNFDLLGGEFYLSTSLGYLRNFGDKTYSQYNSTPVRIGYTQNLLGYNPFRWERKIEPLKYEKVKKELIHNLEGISETATSYFFALALAQVEYDMAKENVASSDTLYRIGQERQRIASITREDLLTLRLESVNARNQLQNAEIDLKRAMFSLASFLNFDRNTDIRLTLPGKPKSMDISADMALAYARENNPQFLENQQKILEAEQNVDKTRKESMFNASINASVGFNQVARDFRDVYTDPLRQDPLVDWGVRKGNYNVAKNNLNVAQIQVQQSELSIEEDIIITVGEFNVQQQMILSQEEALDIAIMAYNETRQRFIMGQADINSLTLSLNRQQAAQRNYISALNNYWLTYYKIRKLTLFDFETGVSLSNMFDYSHHIR